MDVKRIAAFSNGNQGGNPAGVVIADQMPSKEEMFATAKEVGYSETAFLKPEKDGWRIRHFSPEIEVPFCGHATIASGAALGKHSGAGIYKLYLNEGEISVCVTDSGDGTYTTTLKSPGTWSKPVSDVYVARVLKEFGWTAESLDTAFPPRLAFAGARHLVLVLKNRQTLAGMSYDMEALKAVMAEAELVTVALLWADAQSCFHARNVFPPGGIYEDPATGSAAAAFAGYLRDMNWPGGNKFHISQGEDMGSPSRLDVKFTSIAGEGIEVTGKTRDIE